ncbi:MAG TPA: hypothetical protein V6C86_22995 [Oculatellaceae cyanobacterium]
MQIHEAVVIALISAGVGATISSLFTLAGQHFERRHQKRQLVFKSALEVSQKRIEQGMEAAKMTGNRTEIPDLVILSGTYYKWLESMYEHGQLPPEAVAAEEASIKKLAEAKEERRRKQAIEIERQVAEAAKHPLKARSLLSCIELSMLTEAQLQRLQKGASVSYPEENLA